MTPPYSTPKCLRSPNGSKCMCFQRFSELQFNLLLLLFSVLDVIQFEVYWSKNYPNQIRYMTCGLCKVLVHQLGLLVLKWACWGRSFAFGQSLECMWPCPTDNVCVMYTNFRVSYQNLHVHVSATHNNN